MVGCRAGEHREQWGIGKQHGQVSIIVLFMGLDVSWRGLKWTEFYVFQD
jgi:hypothetical protein